MKNPFKGVTLEPYHYFIIWCISIVLSSTVISVGLYFSTHFEKTIQVKEKYVQGGRRGGRYFVVDTDNKVYKLVDTWYIGEFDRGDDYAKLTNGSSHKIKGYGVRIPFLRQFPRIYSVQ
jgi:hypothetical protein